MKLQQYNQVIFALMSTGVLIVGLITLAIAVLTSHSNSEPQGIVVKTANKAKPSQALVFCMPISIEGSSFEYFPVGAVVQRDADEDPIVSKVSRGMRYADYAPSSICELGDDHVFNIAIRKSESGEEKLLLGQPARVESLKGPSAKCKSGQGDMPCELLLWTIRPSDTNRDGVINQKDALVAYVSKLSGDDLQAVTPSNANVLIAQWMPKTGRLDFQVQYDTNKDGKFSKEDGSEVLETDAAMPSMAHAIFHAPLMKSLQGAIK